MMVYACVCRVLCECVMNMGDVRDSVGYREVKRISGVFGKYKVILSFIFISKDKNKTKQKFNDKVLT